MHIKLCVMKFKSFIAFVEFGVYLSECSSEACSQYADAVASTNTLEQEEALAENVVPTSTRNKNELAAGMLAMEGRKSSESGKSGTRSRLI